MSHQLRVVIDELAVSSVAMEAANSVLENIGRLLTDEIVENISVQGPPRSQPGEYPRRDTGELSSSVYFQVIDGTLYVGNDADHAEHVEDIRPFMIRTFEEIQSDIRNLVERL